MTGGALPTNFLLLVEMADKIKEHGSELYDEPENQIGGKHQGSGLDEVQGDVTKPVASQEDAMDVVEEKSP